jgi:hypothetical protein
VADTIYDGDELAGYKVTGLLPSAVSQQKPPNLFVLTAGLFGYTLYIIKYRRHGYAEQY